MGMRPKSCPGLAAYSIAWHEWLQPGPRRIASTRLICFSSGSPAVDILALPPAASALPLKGMRGPTPPHPANPRAAALQAPPLRQPLTRRAAEPIATLTAKGARAKGGAARRAPPTPVLENHDAQDALRPSSPLEWSVDWGPRHLRAGLKLHPKERGGNPNDCVAPSRRESRLPQSLPGSAVSRASHCQLPTRGLS